MKKKKIIKIINNAMIVSYVLNFTPTFAMENVDSENKQEIILSSTEENNIVVESKEDSSELTDNNIELADEIKNNNESEEIGDEESDIKDEEEFIYSTDNEAVNNEDSDFFSNEIKNDETIVLDENNNDAELENTEILSERAVIEDNWVNREVAKQVYGDGSKYTQLTDDDYLKITELVYNNWSTNTIPSDLFKLKNLEVLDLTMPNCNEVFPSEICELTKLRNLTIDVNFIGELPFELINLKNLETLYLSVDCTGSIPESIGSLKKLTSLSFDFCRNLTGHIPESIYDLVNLEKLSIYSCSNITGEISKSIGNLTNLNTLYIDGENITGNIPESIGNLTNLIYLYITGTKMTGSIPDTICNLVGLSELYISANDFLTGCLPDNIGNLSNLKDICVDYNKNISGEIPSSIGNLSSVKYMNFSGNSFSGSIPKSIGKLSTVSNLNFSENNLTGEIPETIGNMSSLRQLNLSKNNLTGNIPESLLDGSNITIVDLSYNKLTGLMPSSIDSLYTKNPWFQLYVSNNQLIGELSSTMLQKNSNYFKNNLFSNGQNQAQIKFEDDAEIEVDFSKPININDIKNKLFVERNNNGSISYDTLNSEYNIEVTSDNESILTNDLRTLALGETEITVSLDVGTNSNAYTTTNNKLKVKVTDLSSPELNLEQSTTDWTNSSVTIKGSASDNYILDRIVLPDGTEVKTSEFEYTVITNGEYTFEAYDSFNNKTTKTITVNNIDTEKPIISVDKVIKDNNTVDLKIDVEDSLSGVKEISVNGVLLKNLKNPTVNITKNGSYNIVVLDDVGNESSYNVDVTEIKPTLADSDNDNNPNVEEDTNNTNNDKENLLNSIPSTGGIAGVVNSVAVILLAFGASLVGRKKSK